MSLTSIMLLRLIHLYLLIIINILQEDLKIKMSTSYERFILANQRLIKCFDGVTADRFNQASQDEQSAFCSNEKNEVTAFL
jgi:hypothetical protein